MKLMQNLFILTSLTASAALAESTKAVQANNRVGLHLMQEATKQENKNPESKNIMVSPLSANEALSMALNGAAGNTQKEFLKFFGYSANTSLAEINSANEEVRNSLVKTPMTEEAKKNLKDWEKPSFGFTVANSAFHTNGATDGRNYSFRKEYVTALKSGYNVAKPQALDFMKKEAADTINHWASDNTNGMIKEIIDSETLKEMLWALLNATYLEGAWVNGFEVIKGSETKPNFTLVSEKKVNATMMKQTSAMGYYEDSQVQAVELALHDTTVVVYVVLPKTMGDFLKLQNDFWSSKTLETIIEKSKSEYGNLTMPKFSFDYGVTMKEDDELTRALGLNFLFKNTADLSNMDAPGAVPSKVGIIKQNTRLEWSESGIRAAAVTLVGGIERTSTPVNRFEMTVDRPFFFVIHDKKTKSHLFLGQVVNPVGK